MFADFAATTLSAPERLFLFAFGTVGLTLILVDGAIFQRPRKWLKTGWRVRRFPTLAGILRCYMCCGFWSGLLTGWFLIPCPLICLVILPAWGLPTVCLRPHVFACGVAGSLLSATWAFWRDKTVSQIGLTMGDEIDLDLLPEDDPYLENGEEAP